MTSDPDIYDPEIQETMVLLCVIDDMEQQGYFDD